MSYLEPVLAKKNKDYVLNSFVYNHKDLPKQGSKEWLDNKKFVIGGSEISIILNKNPYQKTADLVKSHLNIKPFNKNLAIHWGNIFEDIIKIYLNKLLKCEIIETGSIPHHTNKHISYSPDGISIVKTRLLEQLINIDKIKEHYLTVLFEFKCPLSRLPQENKIPDYYIDQPRLGLHTIPLCDIAVFVEAVFRICSYEQLALTGSFSKSIHKDLTVYEQECMNGCLILYYSNIDSNILNNEELDDEDMETFKNLCSISKLADKITKSYPKAQNKQHGYFDIGQTDYFTLSDVIKNTVENKLFVMDKTLLNLDLNDSVILQTRIIKQVDMLKKESKTIFAIIPYKLMKIFSNSVAKPKHDFLNEKVSCDITKVINLIKEIDIDDSMLSEIDKKICNGL